MGIRAWTTETSSACAQAVVHVAHECWIALWRLLKYRSDSGGPDAPQIYRLDTEIHTSDGRLSLDLDWNTTQADATPLKEIPRDVPGSASCRPDATSTQSQSVSVEPDIAYIKSNRASPSPSPQVATFKLDVASIEPDAASDAPILTSAMPDVASESSTGSMVTAEEDLTKPDLPVDSKRDSRNLPEVVCFSDIPIPVEGNIIENYDGGGLQRNASQRVSFLQTGLHFGSAVDLRSTSSISAQSSPGLQSEFQSQSQPVYDNTPQQRPSFQYSPQPRQSFQHSPQPRQSFQSATHPFQHHNRPPSYRSPSPLPVYLQRYDSVGRGNPEG